MIPPEPKRGAPVLAGPLNRIRRSESPSIPPSGSRSGGLPTRFQELAPMDCPPPASTFALDCGAEPPDNQGPWFSTFVHRVVLDAQVWASIVRDGEVSLSISLQATFHPAFKQATTGRGPCFQPDRFQVCGRRIRRRGKFGCAGRIGSAITSIARAIAPLVTTIGDPPLVGANGRRFWASGPVGRPEAQEPPGREGVLGLIRPTHERAPKTPTGSGLAPRAPDVRRHPARRTGWASS